MKKLVLLLLSGIVAFAININTASKSDLMSIKGIGEKKANALIKYRKSHKNMKTSDLKNVKGFGSGIIKNVIKGVETKTKAKKNSMKNKFKNKKSEMKAKVKNKLKF
jgi:competence protein ComEA